MSTPVGARCQLGDRTDMLAGMNDYVGSAELVEMFGVSKQRVYQLTSREDFPAPVAVLKMGKVWRTENVLSWASVKGRDVKELDART